MGERVGERLGELLARDCCDCNRACDSVGGVGLRKTYEKGSNGAASDRFMVNRIRVMIVVMLQVVVFGYCRGRQIT